MKKVNNFQISKVQPHGVAYKKACKLQKSLTFDLYSRNSFSTRKVLQKYILFGIEFSYTAEKMKFSIKDFFSKCDQIRSLQFHELGIVGKFRF